MNMNRTNPKELKLQQAIQKYKNFLKNNDFKDIREYYMIGLDAEVFVAPNGDPLTKNDDLWWGFFTDKYGNILWDTKDFHKAVYQYTFRRQPVRIPQKDPNQELLRQLKGSGVFE